MTNTFLDRLRNGLDNTATRLQAGYRAAWAVKPVRYTATGIAGCAVAASAALAISPPPGPPTPRTLTSPTPRPPQPAAQHRSRR